MRVRMRAVVVMVVVVVIVAVFVVVVVMLTFVIVLVKMHVKAVLRLGSRREDIECAVLHAARRNDLIGEVLELVTGPFEDDDIEAVHLIERHVHRRANFSTQGMLELGQPRGEIAHAMIVDDGHRRNGIGAYGNGRARHLAPREIAQ